MLALDSSGQMLDRPIEALIDTATRTVLSSGAQLGPYKIEAAIGAGGMGTVYRAIDTRLGRVIAIKIAAERYSERFQLEARAISTLNHPHVCTLYDVGPNYLVMEFIEGSMLAAEIKKGPLPAETAVRYGTQIAGALAEAHSLGIVHRDLKPGNIMVTRHGVKVLDFGLAKVPAETGITQSNAIMGTPAYMSPEQILGRDADARSDLFALGIIIYEMASGRHPWAQAGMDTMHAIVHDDPPPIHASVTGAGMAASIERIVRRCLAKQPQLRFQTMAELEATLRQAAAEPASNAAGNQPSIAVLPFANMSADKENEYFGDGLAEEVINSLAQLPAVKVAGRTSSFFFRGKDIEFAEIAKRLSVEHILEGSVRRSGNRIRVTTQLIKAADGFHLWSERYDRELTDIFAIQDEITQSIAGALRIRLSPENIAGRRHEPNLRAYDAYLKAREQWFRLTPESLPRVKELLEQAIAIDPEFALAYSLLGVHYTGQASFRPARELISLARAAEQEALRVDPALPEAHALLACCDGMNYEWTEAEQHWRLAMARNPVSRDVLFWHANHYLLPVGRAFEAVKAETAVLDQDPLNLLYRHHYAVALLHADRAQDAEVELRRVLEINENSQLALGTLGSLCARQARFDEALALTERAYALRPHSNAIAGQLAALLFRAGSTDRADALLETLRSGNAYGAPTGLALFHALRGEFDRAAHWAGEAIEERYPNVVAILGPFLRPTPQWPALAKRMHLPAA